MSFLDQRSDARVHSHQRRLPHVKSPFVHAPAALRIVAHGLHPRHLGVSLGGLRLARGGLDGGDHHLQRRLRRTKRQRPTVQLLTIGVVILGISAAFYTFGGLLEMVLEGELERVLGHRRRTKGIEQLRDHVVICGFGRIGQVLAEDLARQRVPLVVIDLDPASTAEAGERNLLYLEGDATADETLIATRLQHARTLVTCLPNDAANVFITLTGRNLNPTIQIIARAEHRSSERKLIQAGANRVVMPAANGARRIAPLVTRPSTADVVELVTERDDLDFVLDELLVTEGSRLGGPARVGHAGQPQASAAGGGREDQRYDALQSRRGLSLRIWPDRDSDRATPKTF